MSSMNFNDRDAAEDVAFPRISAFDPAASPPPEPPPAAGEVLSPIAPGLPDDVDIDIDPADLAVDESELDEEQFLEAANPEPEQITDDIEIGVD